MGMGSVKKPGLEDQLERIRREDEHKLLAWDISFSDFVETEGYTSWFNTLDQSQEDVPKLESMVGSDMVLVAYKRPPKNIERLILHNLGLDIDEPYEEQILLHRNVKGDIVNTLRWIGKMRTDKYINLTMKNNNIRV